MRVLVTGGSGFLGRHLLPALRAAGHEVVAPTSADCDLRRPGALTPFRSERFDRLVHLAAWTRAGTFCRRRAGEQWRVQQAVDAEMLAFWADHQPSATLVTFGTSVAYAPSLELHREDDYLAGVPSDHYFGYAMAKRSLYAGCRALGGQHGLRWLHLVPSTLYGPDYHLDGRPLHFVYDLVRKILRANRGGPPVVLWGDGRQRRELVYIDDAVAWILALCDRAEQIDPVEQAGPGLVNLGAGVDYSIRDIARSICRVADHPFEEISFDADAFVGARAKSLDVRRLDALLPTRRRTPLESGLEATVAWAERHLDALEPREETLPD
ncbi:MAG: NAD-dependent epimerase/dehydratase family protein [Acidobacteriota bacterium]